MMSTQGLSVLNDTATGKVVFTLNSEIKTWLEVELFADSIAVVSDALN